MYEYQYIVMDTGGGIFVNNMEANHVICQEKCENFCKFF